MIIAVIFAAALAGAPDTAPTAVPVPAAPAAVAAADDPNKVICHSEEVTGSRLGHLRVCMTKAKWDERAAADRSTLESYTKTQVPGK